MKHPDRSPEEAGLFLLWELVVAEHQMAAYLDECLCRLHDLAPVVINGGWWEKPELEEAREAVHALRLFAPSGVWLGVLPPWDQL